jgi:hypothetical protein
MTEPEDIIITMPDIRAARMCSGGSREFFHLHNLDWQDFLQHGIPASKLLATGDSMAVRLVEVARGRK